MMFRFNFKPYVPTPQQMEQFAKMLDDQAVKSFSEACNAMGNIKKIVIYGNPSRKNWLEERLQYMKQELEKYNSVYLINENGKIIGLRSRYPRKMKKALKKSGDYEGRPLKGIPIKPLWNTQGK